MLEHSFFDNDQILHFDILLEDDTVLAAFGGASRKFRMSILRKIIKLLLHIASASAQSAAWTHRSIATSTALICKRVEAEFSHDFGPAKEDDTLKEVELLLGEDGVRQIMRSIVTGFLVKDAEMPQGFPPLTDKADNHLIISLAWVAAKFDEMSKVLSEKLFQTRRIGTMQPSALHSGQYAEYLMLELLGH